MIHAGVQLRRLELENSGCVANSTAKQPLVHCDPFTARLQLTAGE
jgi:hypothetical protein